MPHVTTRQATIDARSDKLALAVAVAVAKLDAARDEARHYRRWDMPDRVRAAVKEAEKHLDVAEGVLREHGERNGIGRPARTGQSVFQRGGRR